MLGLVIHIVVGGILYLLLGNLKHEGAHAIAAKLRGYKITAFKFWPHKRDGRWMFGWVSWSGPHERHILLAPYYVDAALLAGLVVFLALVPASLSHWYAAGVMLMGALPVVDIARAWWKYRNGWGDWHEAERN